MAILLAPSWVAGIHKSRARLYLPLNFISALAWSLTFGLGAYYIGPPILELASDWGTVGIVALVALIVAGVSLEIYRRARRHRGTPSGEDKAPASADAPARVSDASPAT
jgi:membrane protein DedA with SNARE-associated domain